MKNINCLLVRSNGLTVSFQAAGWVAAARKMLESIDSIDVDARQGFGPGVEKVFTSTGSSLEEHKVWELREALKDGTLAKIDGHLNQIR